MSWIRSIWQSNVILVETDQGTQVLDWPQGKPDFLHEKDEVEFDPENEDHAEFHKSIKDYLETFNDPYSFQWKRRVWVGQYVMPGYMDCSPLDYDTNKKELIKRLNENYGPQRS